MRYLRLTVGCGLVFAGLLMQWCAKGLERAGYLIEIAGNGMGDS